MRDGRSERREGSNAISGGGVSDSRGVRGQRMYTAPRRRETGREGSGVGRKVSKFGESAWLVTIGEVSERMITEVRVSILQ